MWHHRKGLTTTSICNYKSHFVVNQKVEHHFCRFKEWRETFGIMQMCPSHKVIRWVEVGKILQSWPNIFIFIWWNVINLVRIRMKNISLWKEISSSSLYCSREHNWKNNLAEIISEPFEWLLLFHFMFFLFLFASCATNWSVA